MTQKIVAPEYACAVIENVQQHLLLQLRPTTARHAPGQLTCFGGRREADEDDLTCLQRELREELAWQPLSLVRCCELWKGSRFIAQFFRASYLGGQLITEPGHHAVWVPWSALAGLPISPWHQAILQAVAEKRPRVDL